MFIDAGRESSLKIVPLMVGDLSEERYWEYAEILLPLFRDKRTVFIVSSENTHWGDKRSDIKNNKIVNATAEIAEI